MPEFYVNTIGYTIIKVMKPYSELGNKKCKKSETIKLTIELENLSNLGVSPHKCLSISDLLTHTKIFILITLTMY